MRNKYQGVSAFQKRVYESVSRVPLGRVTTYKLVAAAIGCGSARAIGQALKKNPFAPKVPCHRVIASDLRIGGFQGKSTGITISRKLELLKEEGVAFSGSGKLLQIERIFSFH
jgi:methylated-DNA-[protein]-cysteine S-methyltransferase